ncbi:hypothetical protein MMSR116_06060 [Methylobacterium mesophilicum SR1.6/6]|uniref:Uncharacterized protein n=1 Tax=Methylobacterium mesophilicum SR1.6/6 TaxID=908290 RepID=A0A6B9FG12_9HYPH|nr:hypothetical protein [Methylobacterium mesophilicum]QGY01517.1 hypothetical protein MMSR116_06060 [Methylobacterium mesophilicum SR1.6/6]
MREPADRSDPFAWDVIAQVSELLAPHVEDAAEGVRAAFELVEDALADRAHDTELGIAEART